MECEHVEAIMYTEQKAFSIAMNWVFISHFDCVKVQVQTLLSLIVDSGSARGTQDLSDGETFIITINVVAGLREQQMSSVRAVQREARKRREKPSYTVKGANNSTEQIQL